MPNVEEKVPRARGLFPMSQRTRETKKLHRLSRDALEQELLEAISTAAPGWAEEWLESDIHPYLGYREEGRFEYMYPRDA